MASRPRSNFVSGLTLASLLAVLAGATACGSSDPDPEAALAAKPEPVAKSAPAPARKANSAPRIDGVRFEPDSPVAGDTLKAIANASDAENDGLWFEYAWKLDGTPAGDGQELLLRGTKGQSVEVSVIASDGQQKSQAAWARVEIENRPPEIVEVGVEPGRDVVVGTPIVVHPDARDLDGDRVTYQYEWTVNGRLSRETGPLLETKRLGRGDAIRVRVIANDGDDDSEAFEMPPIVIVNSPPRFVSQPPTKLADGTFTYKVVAQDPDGDSQLEFSLEGAPTGMNIDSFTGLITWKPSAEQAGTHPVTVVADDLHKGLGRHVFEVRVSSPGNDAPAAPSS